MRLPRVISVLPFVALLCVGASAQTGITPVAVTASRSSGTAVPERAVDGNVATTWNAGAFGPQWIQLDLGRQYTVAKVRLATAQSPAGRTVHQIYGGPTPDSLTPIATLDDVTRDGQWLEMSCSASRVRYLKVSTTVSPSWVGWREIQVDQGLQYYGYYGSAFSWVGTGNYTAEISGHSNVTWIAGGTTCDHVTRLQEANSLGIGAVMVVNNIFFDKVLNLRPTYQQDWLDYVRDIKPHAQAVAAFYPMDEPFLNLFNRPPEEFKRDLETVNALIKKSFPDKPIAVIFAWQTVTSPHFPNLVIPNGYDWVGFDCYPQTLADFDNCEGHSIPWYVNAVKSKLSANQKMIMVPGGLHVGTDLNQALARQAEIAGLADKFFTLTQADPAFVGMFTFIYQSQHACNEDWTGTRDMPQVKAKYQQIGQSIVSPTSHFIYFTPSKASNTHGTSGSKLVADGDLGTSWNSGGFAPQWILLDLGQLSAVSKIRLNVAQSPAGDTTHQLYGGATPDNMSLLGTLKGSTQDGQWLELLLTKASNVRYLRVDTVASPSWVGWREIQVFR